ncbi:MAG TPA: MCE family protein [Actinomycetota bacterium]|nr:MCE family protein [Actinomycetota bacterium]
MLTALFLTGSVRAATVPVYAEFERCGQGIRVGGDAKLRGVLVGRIGALLRSSDTPCRIRLDLVPETVDQIPANVGAQIRAKTVFGEKWVEILYPEAPVDERIAANDTIDKSRTIDPLEVETILNIALPLLDAVDPEALSGALNALSGGFVGHEDAIIKSIEEGIAALRPMNADKELFEEGLDQLETSAAILEEIDEDLIDSLRELDRVNVFTAGNSQLIADTLDTAPELLGDLSKLFQTNLIDFVKLANEGATVISLVAARADDVERLLSALPRFTSGWIRNLSGGCPVRQITTEPGLAKGDLVPGRCWRVHNIISESRGPYAEGEEPKPGGSVDALDYLLIGITAPTAAERIFYAHSLGTGASR